MSHDGEVLLTPDEWCKRKGIVISDPDGWRAIVLRVPGGSGPLTGPKGLDEPLSESEFDQRASVSSCISRAASPKAVVRYADGAMYRSEPTPAANRAPGGGTRPTVTLLNATPDPLGSLAALCGIYTGKVTRSLAGITDAERRQAWDDMRSTVLNGPLEAIQFHFLIEGVTRAFTHQAVRNRFSFFAQESMRFAVVEDESWVDRCGYPPSLAGLPVQSHLMGYDAAYPGAMGFVENPDYGPEEHDYALRRDAWDDAIIVAQQSYQKLIDAGVPAEDARGLMPHAMTTRYHWVVSARTLLGEAGKRLCTQAQFEWRMVMAEVARALRTYGAPTYADIVAKYGKANADGLTGGEYQALLDQNWHDHWQFALISDALQPICYQEGKCGFMAKFDRGCKIRERVNANAAAGRSSSKWNEPLGGKLHSNMETPGAFIPAIHPEEWLADPGAAR